MIRTYVRGPDLGLLGEIRGVSLEITLRHMAVSNWQVKGVADGLITRLQQSGCGLIAVDLRGVPLHSPGGVLISGDVEDDGPRTWSASGQDSGPGTLQISGGDDLAVVADELAFSDPTQPVTNQTAAAYDARSGAAETVIKGYVGANVGVSRHANRGDVDVPNARLVTLATDAARGSTVSYKARFDPLMDIVRTLASTSTPQLGVRVQQLDDDLVFDVYEPVDRTGRVVFGEVRRNLRGYAVTRSSPTVTHVVVAGQGEGTARVFRQRRDVAAAQEWRRIIRTFVDQRQTSATAELDAAGDEALASGRRSGVLSATAVDTPQMRFGQHFALGDLVTVEIEPGVSYSDRVTAVKIVADEGGTHPAEITIGNPDLDPKEPEVYARVRALESQILALQRRY